MPPSERPKGRGRPPKYIGTATSFVRSEEARPSVLMNLHYRHELPYRVVLMIGPAMSGCWVALLIGLLVGSCSYP
jgi:AT hook motif